MIKDTGKQYKELKERSSINFVKQSKEKEANDDDWCFNQSIYILASYFHWILWSDLIFDI